MSIELLGDTLRSLGVDAGEISADTRLRADLGLDSVETSELELELDRRFGTKVDLWDATDYSLAELAALVQPARPRPGPPEAPRVPADRAQRYRDAGWWRAQPLADLVLGAGERDPGRCALVAGERRLSHGELAGVVDRAAARLRALGVGSTGPVVVQLPNTLEYVVLVLALLRLGVPPVLVPPALREYELDRILGLTTPDTVAVPARTRRTDHVAMVDGLRERHPCLTRLLVPGGTGDGVVDLTELCTAAGPDTVDGPAPDPAGTALFLLSSGTTGPPKLMARSHEDYGYIVRGTAEVAGVTADTVYLAVLPATHTFVLAYPGVLGTLAAGGTVVLDSAEDPRRTVELVERERVTHVAAVPGLVTQWLNLLDAEPHDASSLAVLQVGGARLDPPLAERAAGTLPCAVQQVYGMSEGLANFTRLDDPVDVAWHSQGRPTCPGDEILVVDEDERPVPPGQVGQLLTRGPSTVAGYYRDPVATEQAFTADGHYRTGDLVVQRPDGNVVVTGRIKNLINRGGEKIGAEELEELTRELPQVAAAAAVPMPHPVHGEIACLFVVAAGDRTPHLQEIRRHLQQRGLARFKLPERLELIDAMPLIGVGKLDRTALRERAAALA